MTQARLIPSRPTDNELLARYDETHAEAPFEELVARYGKFVYGVCSRVLGKTSDAEDAAQSVLLTLLKKAKPLRECASLAGWLHRTALFVSLRAKEAATLRKRREAECAACSAPSEKDDSAWAQVRPILDQELDALPDIYRKPLILHYLEGHSQEQTAKIMGCSFGTVSGRLSRARLLLHDRLLRRGVTMPVAILFALISRFASAGETEAGWRTARSSADPDATVSGSALMNAVTSVGTQLYPQLSIILLIAAIGLWLR
jgi:RNA polymerase sigma factor (sigma-70 family)